MAQKPLTDTLSLIARDKDFALYESISCEVCLTTKSSMITEEFVRRIHLDALVKDELNDLEYIRMRAKGKPLEIIQVH